MSFSSRFKPRRCDASRRTRFSARCSRRRVALKIRANVASCLAGAFFLNAPLFALPATVPNASDRANYASCANFPNNATNANRASLAVDEANANRVNLAVDEANANRAVGNLAEDAIPSFGALSARPAVLCKLAGIPAAPLKQDVCANWETPTSLASSFNFPHFPSLVPLVSNAPSSQTVQTDSIPQNAQTIQAFPTSPIIRGGYISNLPIAPFRGRVFAYADGSWGKQAEQNADPFAAGFSVASFGGGVGQDWRLSKNAIWGLGFQGRNVQLEPDASIYESEIDSLAGFLRLSLFGPLWRLDFSIGAAKNWNEQNLGSRDVTKYSSSQWNYEAEFGVRFDKGYTRVEPLVNVRVLTLQEPTEAERRFVLNGRPSDYADASYRLKLGSRFSWEYATHLATLKPYLTATWAHEFGDRALYTVGENTPFPIAYRYAKHKMARDRLDLGGGVDAALRDTVDVFFRYDVEFAKEYSNYLFYAGFHKKF